MDHSSSAKHLAALGLVIAGMALACALLAARHGAVLAAYAF